MKIHRLLSYPALVLTVLFSFSNFALAENKQELLFGSVAMDIPAVMHKRLKPLTQYLSEQLGKPVELKLSPNMGVAIKEIPVAYKPRTITQGKKIRARDFFKVIWATVRYRFFS